MLNAVYGPHGGDSYSVKRGSLLFFLSRVPTVGISLSFSSFLSRGYVCVTLELINRDFASSGRIAIPTH